MGFSIVSESVLLREMIASYCVGEGFGVQGLFSRLSEIPDNWPFLDVILFLSEDGIVDDADISDFQSRFVSGRIVLLVSSTVSSETINALTPLVDALILDDRSLQTLTGFLTVVQEGFNISPANGMAPQAEPSQVLPNASTNGDERRLETSRVGATAGSRVLQRSDQTAEDRTCLAKLSPREREVLRRLRDGQSNKDIAKHLDIVESTVKVHLRGCFRKIGAQNRTQAAVWAAQHLPD